MKNKKPKELKFSRFFPYFPKMKKAQGLPLNTIIIAAIVLVVLVILLLFFTGKFSVFSEGTIDCSSGQVVSKEDKCPNDYPIAISITETEYCCKKLGS